MRREGVIRRRFVDLLHRVRSGDLAVSEFYKDFEYCWNFETRPDDLNALDKQRLERVFDIVAWYSPCENERDVVQGHKDEAAVLSISNEVLEALSQADT